MQLGSGCVFNHSSDPNIRPVRYDGSPFVWAWVATRRIDPGAELLFDYGHHYWNRRGLTPT